MTQDNQDQLSPLIKCAFSDLYAKWDYNNDLYVLAEERRDIRDILTLYILFGHTESWEESNSMCFQMTAIEMHRGVAPVTIAFTGMHF